MKILVIGATGVLGRNVIPRLLERGHQVRAIVRRTEQLQFLNQTGAEANLGDIFDPVSLEHSTRGIDVVLHLATSIPKSEGQDWSLNDRVRREGTHKLLAAATNNGVVRYIQQSITLVYGEQGQKIVDESVSLQLSHISQSAADMEAMVQASALDWSILRGGIFYGHGTGREDTWRQLAQRGQLDLPGDGDDLISLVHVVDFARAIVGATERPSAGSIFNIVDDKPVSYRDLFRYITSQLGVKEPQVGGPKFLPSLGCTNARATQEIGWKLTYSSYRSGLA